MDFPWYKVKAEDECLTQGDIILSCPVPVIDYDEVAYPYFLPEYIEENVIIMTQACDMENRKVRSVTLCRVGLLDDQIKDHFDELNKSKNDYDYNNITPKSKQKYADKIRRGDLLDLYLLDKYNDGVIEHPYRVVHLRDSFRIPLESLERIVQSKKDSILRLLPPYREHLSHNFSFNFSRIGLPIDVKLSLGEF
ncbi:hypothetical protein MOE45_13565 [Bacillus atrophaeus]|nr:hypothetical protein [Bacillus atrophaeus]